MESADIQYQIFGANFFKLMPPFCLKFQGRRIASAGETFLGIEHE
jgi:hypothetical protein